MGRSEQKAKERKAAQQRSLVTPTPSEVKAPVRQGRDLRRGGGVRSREAFELPEFLKPSPIATPKGGKRAAPASPAVDNNGSNGARGENRSGVKPVNGSYRTAVEQSQGVKSEKTGARVNANGLVSYGRDLSSLNAFTKEFTGLELTDIKSAFQSEDLPGAYQTGTNKINPEQTAYELPEGVAPSPLNEGLAGTKDLKISDSNYTIDSASVPGTVGRTGDVQEGISPKADIAESVRTLRMQRKGPRDDGSFRGFQKDNNNRLALMPQEEAPDAAKVAQEKRRNDIRSTFLDMDTPIVKASIAANAKAGFGKNSDGQAMFNYGGELVQAKDGMQQQAKNAAMMGKDPSEFLAIKLDEVKKDQEKNM